MIGVTCEYELKICFSKPKSILGQTWFRQIVFDVKAKKRKPLCQIKMEMELDCYAVERSMRISWANTFNPRANKTSIILNLSISPVDLYEFPRLFVIFFIFIGNLRWVFEFSQVSEKIDLSVSIVDHRLLSRLKEGGIIERRGWASPPINSNQHCCPCEKTENQTKVNIGTI
jgi:hypothetical protein